MLRIKGKHKIPTLEQIEEKIDFLINTDCCYTYIKEIVGGNSIIVLADEEQEALDMAKEANKPAK